MIAPNINLARQGFSIAILAGFMCSPVWADIDFDAGDGWYTWQVRASADAPQMCCFKLRNGDALRERCDLDGRSGGYISDNGTGTGDANAQIYTHVSAGKIDAIRALSGSCPVRSKSAINDLGPIANGDSIGVLEPLLADQPDNASQIIAAIAAHEGNEALDVLIRLANGLGDLDYEDYREESIFWLAQTRISESGDLVKRLALEDQDSDIRKHAAFAYAQSKAQDVSELLIQQGQNDIEADVRSQSWFWLAETGASGGEEAIGSAIKNDPDSDVREDAVFALSQLPDERAIAALVAIIEDSAMDMDVRQKALFWLAQSESEEAFETIDRLLSDN